jgi:hypothetical protein
MLGCPSKIFEFQLEHPAKVIVTEFLCLQSIQNVVSAGKHIVLKISF